MSFLRPVAMVKVGITGLKDDREPIVAALHDLGVVQVEPIGKETLGHVDPERGSDLQRSVADEMIRFRGLKSALPATPPGTPHAFADLPAILTAAAGVPIDDEVGRLKREEDQLLTERKSLTDTIDLLAHYAFYDDRLELLTGPRIVTFFGEAPPEKFAEFQKELLADAHLLQAPQGGGTAFILTVPTASAEAIGRVGQRLGITLTAAPRLAGTRDQALPPLQTRRNAVEARLAEIGARLAALSAVWFPTVLAVEEALTIENRKFDAYGRLGVGRRTFVLEGWIPRRELSRVEQTISTASGGRTHLYEIPTKERGPTMMDNPKGVSRYEFFIRFYALPQSDEWDPTWVFAIAFPLFFGLMLADVGYGLTILLVCLWIIAGFPGGGKLPKGPKNMVKTIVSPWAMKEIAYTLIPGCIIAVIAGTAFDAFFGAHFYPNPILDPIQNAGKLLLLAGYIGVAMVTVGFALGALKEYYHHHLKGAIGKLGGISFTWGISIVGLTILRGQSTSFSADPVFGIGLVLTILGPILLIVTEGAMGGGLGIIEVVSHILSYTRLIGILLASVILALVINQIAHEAIYGGAILGIVFGIVLLLIGQTFNVIIGVFEPGIQGARLLFVENFSKFYEGNGKQFRPLRSNRKYTVAPPARTPDAAPRPA